VVQKWEYKFGYSINETEANGLGDQGWELISAERSGNEMEYIFKRTKSVLDEIEDKLSKSFS